MTLRVSKAGLTASLVYLGLCVYLIATQGLFGESFIALLLGLPWSLVPSFFEFGNVSGALLYILLLLPLVINATILYWMGSKIDQKSTITF